MPGTALEERFAVDVDAPARAPARADREGRVPGRGVGAEAGPAKRPQELA